ncbi:ComGF family competence protein [Bacillus sp. V3B]|uniref:competence type IV pilus minor pilin ComGF n=1 Tax=Bacillus sp. V3B TaxID=2804915 RepID=UPI00210E6303|nr:competence type IV pilus minor pilin ComGF [Bacillus sp. V3B]MCQ6273718.1 ComGF family competence protein [Bacillus sp. V3B]
MKPFNNKGFTFVEMICAFSIFLMIVSFFPLCLRLLYQEGFVEERLQKMEWAVFIGQTKKEIRMSDKVSVVGNRLTLVKDGQSIIYERYGSNIRRRVNLKGHEITLQNIKTVTFEEVVNGVRISVLDHFDQNEAYIIRTILDEESLYAP